MAWPIGLIRSFFVFYLARVFTTLEFGGVDWISCCVAARGRKPPIGDHNRGGSVEKARDERPGRS